MHDELTTLAYTIEAAIEPSTELDAAIWLHLPEQERHAWKHGCNKYSHARQIAGLKSIPRYTSSLDAAMALIPDGERFELLTMEAGTPSAFVSGGGVDWDDANCSIAATPALALCIAAIRSRASLIRESTSNDGQKDRASDDIRLSFRIRAGEQ